MYSSSCIQSRQVILQFCTSLVCPANQPTLALCPNPTRKSNSKPETPAEQQRTNLGMLGSSSSSTVAVKPAQGLPVPGTVRVAKTKAVLHVRSPHIASSGLSCCSVTPTAGPVPKRLLVPRAIDAKSCWRCRCRCCAPNVYGFGRSASWQCDGFSSCFRSVQCRQVCLVLFGIRRPRLGPGHSSSKIRNGSSASGVSHVLVVSGLSSWLFAASTCSTL